MKMELWIRSQSKELLMKSPELRYNRKDNNHSILAYDTLGVYRILGTYKTKDRALEVLDEIHKCIIDKEVLDGCNNILTLANNKSLNEVNQIIGRVEKIAVYEMPKD
jgi:hypothetical protein|nr:MAG TPA: hypothetical protein [Caudoviricetes sp.]